MGGVPVSDIVKGILIGIPLGMVLLYGIVLFFVYAGFNWDWNNSWLRLLRWWKR